MEISNNMVWLIAVIAVFIAAVFAILFRGNLKVLYGKLRIRAAGESGARNIDVANKLDASGAKFRDIVGTTTSPSRAGSTRVGNRANLQDAEFRDIIGEGAPSAESNAAPESAGASPSGSAVREGAKPSRPARSDK